MLYLIWRRAILSYLCPLAGGILSEEDFVQGDFVRGDYVNIYVNIISIHHI